MNDLDPWADPEPWADPAPDPTDDPPHQPATWAPVDLSSILDGTYRPPTPTLLARSDGVRLLYPGLTHSFHGESESGKSMVAQWLAADVLTTGGRVLYLDYESDPGAVVDRLVMFGATRAAIAAGFVYVQPELGPRANAAEFRAWAEHLAQPYALVVLDGVTASLVASGMESKDNDQVTRWSREVPERLAHRTGAAVVMIDHVPKDTSTRGRFAIGAQAKLGRITGAAFTLEPKRALGIGLKGVVALRLGKDRPGQLRRHGGPVRWDDRTQEVARFVLDATGGLPRVSLVPPADDADDSRPFRPSALMEKISRELDNWDEPRSKSQIEQHVNGKTIHVRQALALLVDEGFVAVQPGPRNSILHTNERPYRQADDPHSDVFTGQPELGTAAPGPTA